MQQGPQLNEIRRTAFDIARSAVAAGFDREKLLVAAKNLQAIPVDGTHSGWVGVACEPDCSFCCFAPALGTVIDLIALADHIGSHWSQDSVADLLRRLEPYCAALFEAAGEGAIRFRSACPLLSEGLCLAHEHRPASCRGFASADAEMCRMWKDAAGPGFIIQRPNQEDNRAKALAMGVQEGLGQQGQATALLPMAPVLWDLLTDRARSEDILKDPGRWALKRSASWRQLCEASPGDPPKLDIGAEPRTEQLLERFAFDPPNSYISSLRRDDATDLLLRLVAPPAYLDQTEVEEARARVEQAVEDALSLPGWDSAAAYTHLPLLNTVKAGYSEWAMKPLMAKVGRLLCERIAKPIAPELLEPMGARKSGRIRVGIASNNIGGGSPANWSLGWVRGFDRSEFEVIVINLDGEEDADSYRFKDAADRYLHLTGNPLAIARHVRTLDLDYLIYPDLGDGGWNLRFAIFRLARRQAAAWGCPFTSGLPTIDDYLSSRLMEPPDADAHYTEKLVRLPNTGLTYSRVLTGMEHLTRSHLGLPDGHLILMAQYFAKWLPKRDPMLAELSARSKNPIAMIVFGGPYQQRVLRTRFERRGVRILPMPQVPLPVYLRILELCDVSLDSPDFSGGHTTMMSLQVGTPVVTMPGKFMRSRQGLAFLDRANVPGLIADSESNYVGLATDAELVQEASANIQSGPLFNDLAPVRALEAHIRSCAAH